jgi:shikimate kinase
VPQLKITLVGMPGGGKSTVGKQLARQIGVPFVDSDQEIELRIGGSVKQFFEQHGEDAFRDLETETIADLLARAGDRVLATGGGAVLRERN